MLQACTWRHWKSACLFSLLELWLSPFLDSSPRSCTYYWLTVDRFFFNRSTTWLGLYLTWCPKTSLGFLYSSHLHRCRTNGSCDQPWIKLALYWQDLPGIPLATLILLCFSPLPSATTGNLSFPVLLACSHFTETTTGTSFFLQLWWTWQIKNHLKSVHFYRCYFLCSGEVSNSTLSASHIN